MKKQGSNLVTPTGLIALAVLLLVSAYLRIRQLELLLAAAFILCLAAWLWARNSLRRISVEVLDEDCRAFPGQLVEASARLKNEKYLPVIWLRADFPTGDNACVVPVGDGDEPLFPDPNTGERPELSEHFLWVMPHQSVSWSQRAMAVRRGVCRISRVELMSGDGFGLAEETRPAPLEAGFRFIVYPAVRPVSVAPITPAAPQKCPVYRPRPFQQRRSARYTAPGPPGGAEAPGTPPQALTSAQKRPVHRRKPSRRRRSVRYTAPGPSGGAEAPGAPPCSIKTAAQPN